MRNLGCQYEKYDNSLKRRYDNLLNRIVQYLERKRIKLHLMRTEYWMIKQDISHLIHSQKQNRLQSIKILRKYWKNEQFPINTLSLWKLFFYTLNT